LGTFRPIETDRLEEHHMHSEWGEVTAAAAEEINATRSAGGRLIAVGTTVARLMETAVRAESGASGPAPADIMPASAGRRARVIPAWSGRTDLFIRPPFEFHAIDALLTNFHFPRTTLLVLVQTFAGHELIVAAYERAVREEYRFYSYGDAMLIV
jgi:S-adenosylmethionine:tRNA ribosyltransferase-isomerase